MRTLDDIIIDHPRWVAEQIEKGGIGPRRRQLRTMIDLPESDPERDVQTPDGEVPGSTDS